MELNIRIVLTVVTAAIAFWLLIDAKESMLQPNSHIRFRLWCSGFAFGFSIAWLITGGSFTNLLWIKLLGGTIVGFQWAYRVVGTVKIGADHQNGDDLNSK